MAKKVTEDKISTGQSASVELIQVSKKAMSVDVGPIVVAGFADWTQGDTELRSKMQELSGKRYDLLQKLTMGVRKAAENDDNIDLAVYFGADSKAISAMNDRLGVALGIRVAKIVGEGDKAKQKIEYAPEVLSYFPSKEDGPEQKAKKKTLQSNFLHALKKCAQAAEGMISNNIVAKEDKKTGTMLISGPSVKKEFGVDSVLVNEKQKIEGKKGETVTLKAKPSFTQLASMGARKHGTELAKRKDSRVQQVAVDQTKLLEETVKTLVSLAGKIEQPTDKQIKLLDKAFSAIAQCLGYKIDGDKAVGEAAE